MPRSTRPRWASTASSRSSVSTASSKAHAGGPCVPAIRAWPCWPSHEALSGSPPRVVSPIPASDRCTCRRDRPSGPTPRGRLILPLALEYPFWEERYPEALARFGSPIAIGDGSRHGVAEWMGIIEASTDRDAGRPGRRRRPGCRVRSRPSSAAQAGVGGVYDLWRRLKAFLCGKRFVARSRDTGSAGRRTVTGRFFDDGRSVLAVGGVSSSLGCIPALPSPRGNLVALYRPAGSRHRSPAKAGSNAVPCRSPVLIPARQRGTGYRCAAVAVGPGQPGGGGRGAGPRRRFRGRHG